MFRAVDATARECQTSIVGDATLSNPPTEILASVTSTPLPVSKSLWRLVAVRPDDTEVVMLPAALMTDIVTAKDALARAGVNKAFRIESVVEARPA